jgi:hypothetical protein
MVCPQCRTEYRPGFAECADCRVPLVDALPVGAPDRPEGYPRSWELNRQDSRNIAFVKGALIGMAVGWAINSTINFALFTLVGGPVAGARFGVPFVWLSPLLQMIPALGIVLGGYIEQSRRRA